MGTGGSTASTRGCGRTDGVDPSAVERATAASREHVRVGGVDPSTVAGRRCRPEQFGTVDSVDPIRGVGSTVSTGGSLDPGGVGRSAVWIRARRAGRRQRGLCPRAAAATRIQGAGGLGAATREQGWVPGRPVQGNPQRWERERGAETSPLKRLIWRFSSFAGSYGSRDQHAWRPEASADDGISVGCKQPSDRMRTKKNKSTSHRTASSSDLAGRSGVVLMPDAIRPADPF